MVLLMNFFNVNFLPQIIFKRFNGSQSNLNGFFLALIEDEYYEDTVEFKVYLITC